MHLYENIMESTAYIQKKLPFTPEIGIVLGSGLNPMAAQIQSPIVIPYGEIPHFAQSTAPGHEGRFVCGMLEGRAVICMQGRLHGYEGHTPAQIVHPVRVMKQLGVGTLVLTNAAGGINENYHVGDLMVIDDHINFTGTSPSIGANDSRIGPRFYDMSYVYPAHLRAIAHMVAASQNIVLRHGVYIGVNGPQFETPAEIRAFRTMGADAVGMSTVFEATAACQCGLPVLGISMVTNMAAGMLDQALSGEEVNLTAEQQSEMFCKLMAGIVAKLPKS